MKTSAREKEKLNESEQQQARTTVFVTSKKMRCQNLWVNNSRSIYVYATLMFTVEPPDLTKESGADQFPASSLAIYIYIYIDTH